jgi:hypothetical protein
VFAALLQLQRRLGRDQFPLIEQHFYPSPTEMVSSNVSGDFRLDILLLFVILSCGENSNTKIAKIIFLK